MVRVHPFAAVRPLPNIAARVASVPYDVIGTEEARSLAAGNPDSFLHVVRSEIDLTPDIDPYDGAVYARAGQNLRRLLDDGILIHEDEPRMYLYRLVMNEYSQIGLVCCCHIDDYTDNVIKRHERTRRAKEDDRTRHILTTGAHTGPVLMTYRDRPAFDELVRRDVNARPVVHFDAADGVTHTVWSVEDHEPYREIFSTIDVAYVADGHHRAASATRAGLERRAANPSHHGSEEYNWFLAALFPASELTILPYNRLVGDLAGQTPELVRQRLAGVGALERTDRKQPSHPGLFCVYLDGAWYRLKLDAGTIDRADPVRSLDVALLQERVLKPILGIADPTADPRIEFVGGARSPEALQRRVNAGQGAIAFSLYPTSIEQLLNVADAGLIMPPKSTWFEPKLRSGLFVHMLD
ncbi:MAG: DUF1015 domain-containing protein [Planctomycetota bacterium]|jgi:uncharacterized protein (DUF1015 family)